MKAMILAAGRGERMRPLTDHKPKPLLQIGPKSLIEHHLSRLHQAGYSEIVINTAWLGEQIRDKLGDGRHYGVHIRYSDEGESALETGGGIFKALPLLGDNFFLVVNGDIWCDHPLTQPALDTDKLAHLILVDNPDYNTGGDFSLLDHTVKNEPRTLTFSGLGWYHPKLFASRHGGKFPLAPLLRTAIDKRQVSGEHYRGQWSDIGTPTRLDEIRARAG